MSMKQGAAAHKQAPANDEIITISVTIDGINSLHTFPRTPKGQNESVRFLESLIDKHSKHPYSYLMPEIRKAKTLAEKWSHISTANARNNWHKYRNQEINLTNRREKYLKDNNITNVNLKVKIH